MSSAPEQPHAPSARNLADNLDLLLEVARCFINAFAHLGVKLDIALEQLGLHRGFQLTGNLGEDLCHAASERHRLAVDQVELELDAQRGALVPDKLIGGHGT